MSTVQNMKRWEMENRLLGFGWIGGYAVCGFTYPYALALNPIWVLPSLLAAVVSIASMLVLTRRLVHK